MTLADKLKYAKRVAPGCPLLTVLVGFPASGKSTWAKAYSYANGDIVLSSDAIRAELFGSEETQGNPKLVFDTLKERLVENLKKGNDVVVDATSINHWERSDYISIAQEYNAIPVAIVFDTPIEECKRRNQNRDRKVPDFVYDKMATKYEEPTVKEGFYSVSTVDADRRCSLIEHQCVLLNPKASLEETTEMMHFNEEADFELFGYR